MRRQLPPRTFLSAVRSNRRRCSEQISPERHLLKKGKWHKRKVEEKGEGGRKGGKEGKKKEREEKKREKEEREKKKRRKNESGLPTPARAGSRGGAPGRRRLPPGYLTPALSPGEKRRRGR